VILVIVLVIMCVVNSFLIKLKRPQTYYRAPVELETVEE
jgi:hypothetical protein